VLSLLALPALAAGAKKGFLEPAEPKWGDTVRLIYRADLPGANLPARDGAMALVTIWFPEGRYEKRRIPLTVTDGRLEGSMQVPRQASYLNCSFVTRDAYGTDTGAMVYTSDGKPAREAWHQSIFHPWRKDYRERVARELALYPDNWSVFRDKWFSAGAFEMAERDAMIRADLPRITGSTAGALYSLNYGHLLLGEEEAARAALREMVDRYPDEPLTAQAIHSYEYENFVRHFPGEGPKQVRQWLVEFNRRNPESLAARESLDSIGGDANAVETVEAICAPWMRQEPENPRPYLFLASAYRRANQKSADALGYIEKALDLLAAGQLRLHGDLYGKMTDLLLPGTFVNASALALENRQYGKALAYAKSAQTIGAQTMPDGFAAEARVWAALGRAGNEQAAWKEAWHRGDKSAQTKLSGSDEGSVASGRKAAPAFHGTTLDGREIDSAQLRGKVVVANFWFMGCGPCKAEIPDLNELAREFSGKDVVFLAFTFDDDEAVLRRFLKEFPFEYGIVPRAGKIAEGFGIQMYPSHVIVGADGKVESMLTGGGEHRAEELRTVIERLVSTAP
jgi:thiol-disulfide isomerase/thioredoxin